MTFTRVVREHVRLLVPGLRMLTIVATVAGGLALANCGNDETSGGETPATSTEASSPAGGIPGNLTTITISDNKFSPGSLQIPVGAKVTWRWTGKNEHEVVGTFDEVEVDSPRQRGEGTFSFAFEHAGVFAYQCAVHGAAMSGTVTVQ